MIQILLNAQFYTHDCTTHRLNKRQYLIHGVISLIEKKYPFMVAEESYPWGVIATVLFNIYAENTKIGCFGSMLSVYIRIDPTSTTART